MGKAMKQRFRRAARPRDLILEPAEIDSTHVECPTCHAYVGWACGQGHCLGAHRARILRELRRLGREIRIMRHPAFIGEPFVFDLRKQCYYDLSPGYRSVFVRRVGEPLNLNDVGLVDGRRTLPPSRLRKVG